MVNISRFFIGFRHPFLATYADVFRPQTSNQVIRLASRVMFDPPWGPTAQSTTRVGFMLRHKAGIELKFKIAQVLLDKFPRLLKDLSFLEVVAIKDFEFANSPTHIIIKAFYYKGEKIEFRDLFILDCMFRGKHLRDL